MTKWRNLAVEGALAFTPQIFTDDRGVSVSPFQAAAFADALGHRSFPAMQIHHSISRRGVVRGAHFTRTPPGVAKYAYCARGRLIDMVVDVRTGSPTYGLSDSVLLDEAEYGAVYLPVGVAHAFVALEDDTVLCHLTSGEHVPENELAISVYDAALGLSIPRDVEPIMSRRDLAAPTLAEVEADGLLPDYARCQEIERVLFAR